MDIKLTNYLWFKILTTMMNYTSCEFIEAVVSYPWRYSLLSCKRISSWREVSRPIKGPPECSGGATQSCHKSCCDIAVRGPVCDRGKNTANHQLRHLDALNRPSRPHGTPLRKWLNYIGNMSIITPLLHWKVSVSLW